MSSDDDYENSSEEIDLLDSEEEEEDNKPQNSGCLDITDQAWEQIIRYYRLTYRGPKSEQELKQQLEGYLVLTKTGFVAKGHFIRYMGKGLVGNNLQRGGWVVKCNKKTILLENGRRKWRVNRLENYIFVKETNNPVTNKTKTRIFMEQLLQQDEAVRTLKVKFDDDD